MTFGKNRVQYGTFDWMYYDYEAFETYFYLNGRELALFTANYAKQELAGIEKTLETSLSDKIQFIVFNNLSDLKQTNIGLINEQNYNTGGITHIMGRKVILYFDGDHKEFEKQIRAGIAHVLINGMMYGGSLGSQITSSTLLVLPEWYVKGLVSYLSGSWSTQYDDRVKDGILSGNYEKFNHLIGTDALYAGHSIWKYIADEYGERSISDIVYMTKISKNVESGFLFVLGISFSNLVNEWLNHYKAVYDMSIAPGTLPANAPLIKRPKKEVVYDRVKLSPDGKYLAYTTNEIGKSSIWLYDLQSGKKTKIYKFGFKLDEKTDLSYPLLSWYPNGSVLAYMTEAKGKTFLHYYNIRKRKTDKIPFYRFEKIVDFSYSHDAKYFVMSAVQKGQSDLFVYNIASRTYYQVTNDIYDDLYPRFINNSQDIIFSSNRSNDTIRFAKYPDLRKTPENHDLFIYEYDKRNPVLRRLTNTPFADEIQAMEYEEGYFTYLSDENGIYNRLIGRFDSAISFIDTTVHYRYFTESKVTTNNARNILTHDVNPVRNRIAEVMYRDGRYRIFLNDALAFEDVEPFELENTEYRNQTITKARKKEEVKIKQKKVISKPRKKFTSVRANEPQVRDSSKIDINNYSFDKQAFINLDIKKDDTSANNVAPKIDAPKEPGLVIPKQHNYTVEYGINNLVSQIDFTFLNSNYQAFTGAKQPIYLYPGLNALFRVGAMDLMEDHRFTGGVRLSANLVNNEYLVSYANLKHRLDHEFVFHRQTIERQYAGVIYSIVRHRMHEFHYAAKWPFNRVRSIRGSAIYRNDHGTFLSISEPTLREPDQVVNWAGLKGEFIHDDTREISMNLYYGTRYKVFGEIYKMIEQPHNQLVVLGFDVRNYQKIHRTFIWANRIAGSTSFGKNKLLYYMGGVDNWLFPKFNISTPVSSENGYAYQTLATNMRGFSQNIRNGNSFLLINSELRFPVFRYFANRPIKSAFFNNFQIVGFGDIGTAWTELDPYSQENSLYTRTITSGPMTITVEEMKNPIVGGYGFGLRSRLLGYFIRADWAWGVEDGVVYPAVFYFSLSLDF